MKLNKILPLLIKLLKFYNLMHFNKKFIESNYYTINNFYPCAEHVLRIFDILLIDSKSLNITEERFFHVKLHWEHILLSINKKTKDEIFKSFLEKEKIYSLFKMILDIQIKNRGLRGYYGGHTISNYESYVKYTPLQDLICSLDFSHAIGGIDYWCNICERYKEYHEDIINHVINILLYGNKDGEIIIN